MQITKKGWPISSVCGIKKRIDSQPDYQRPAVWSLSQKQLLIDTILRGYDVPKFYWRKISTNPDQYEVVDGQQRIRAIWDFQSGEYRVPKKAEAIDGHEVADLEYNDLPDDLRVQFDTYNLDVVIVSDTDEEEVREMFLRLQNGTTLKAQEKRNAMSGKMRDFVKLLTDDQFFKSCGFSNARFTYDLVAAQMILIELAGEPTNVKNADLNRMYERNTDFDPSGQKAKKIKRVLNFLREAFPEKTPELERYSVISLYMLISHLLERYVVAGRQNDVANWFIKFESWRREQRELSVDDCDPEIVAYHEKTSHSTDSEDSLAWRHDYLLRKFLEACPDIEIKDNQRLFTHDQRMAIFRRDKSICQVRIKCDGVKCQWDSWEADHVAPWSKGGKTTVANGQVACLACNTAKGGSGNGSSSKTSAPIAITPTQRAPAPVSTSADNGSSTAKPQREKTSRNSRPGDKLPQKEFRMPLLELMLELGGKASTKIIRQQLEPKVAALLNDADYEQVSTGDPRWWNAVCWERNDLVKGGFLRGDSERGIWELSEQGLHFVSKRRPVLST